MAAQIRRFLAAIIGLVLFLLAVLLHVLARHGLF